MVNNKILISFSLQDPAWQYAAQAAQSSIATSSAYHRSVQDLAAQYSHSVSPASRLQSQYSLFLNSAAPGLARHPGLQAAQTAPAPPQVKTEAPWAGGGEAGPVYHAPAEFSHPLDRNYSPHTPYPNMTG